MKKITSASGWVKSISLVQRFYFILFWGYQSRAVLSHATTLLPILFQLDEPLSDLVNHVYFLGEFHLPG